MSMTQPPTALISVSDKTGLVEFARALAALLYRILSTSGSFKLLQQNQVSVAEVSEYTGFPEILDGRVKTLHPKIHAGILARRGQDDAVLKNHHIDPIDLVIVNLYPFENKTQGSELTIEEAIEWIDIGGPTLIRAAAKNHAFVTVIVSPDDYELVLAELQKNGAVLPETRRRLAAKAFAHTAHYDRIIANYFEQKQNPTTPFLPTLRLELHKAQDLRYGENPHQKAAFYAENAATAVDLVAAKQLQGKPLSFNNIADSDAALACVQAFQEPACVIVKHANPCGVAVGSDLLDAYHKAYATDPTSAFGGIVAFNRPLDEKLAEIILKTQFVEVILAPSVTSSARPILAQKPGVRVLELGTNQASSVKAAYELKQVAGGLLVQEKDIAVAAWFQTVTKKMPTPTELQDLQFAYLVAKYVKSNAIVYVKNLQTIGIGAGQMSRIDSARIAAQKANDAGFSLQGAVMASDAFFPFRDSVDLAAAAGIGAIVQPGGSLRDKEVIEAANEHHLAMVFTGFRHFRH